MALLTDDRLDAVFGALADPTRRAILARLADGDASVTELAEPLPISLPAVSRHLKVLEAAGLISRDRDAQWRPSHLRTETLREALDWIEPFQALWDDRLDRLGAHLRRAQQADGPRATTPRGPTP